VISLLQGIDIVEVAKFRDISQRHADFIADVFTESEREYCMSLKDPYPHFAARFAAKEACLKALGMGLAGSGIDHALKEIEIIHHVSGRPVLSLSGWTDRMARKKGICQFTVSISHSAMFAVASVILIGHVS
jgi:holo-[acyl-carrier protein] synthase